MTAVIVSVPWRGWAIWWALPATPTVRTGITYAEVEMAERVVRWACQRREG